MKEFPPVDYLYIDVPKDCDLTIILRDLPSAMNVIIGSYLSVMGEQSSSRRAKRVEKDELYAAPAQVLLYGDTEKVPFLILVDQSVEFATTCTCDNLYLIHTDIRNSYVRPARLQNKIVIGSGIQIDYLMNQVSINHLIFLVDQLSFIFDEQIPYFTFTYTKEAFCISYGGGQDSNEDETSGNQSDSLCPENAYPPPDKHAKSFGLSYNADAAVTIKFAKGTDLESTTEFPSLNLTLGKTVFGDNIYHN